MISVCIPTISYTHLPRLLPTLEPEIRSVGGELIITNNGARDDTIRLLNKYDCTIINNRVGKTYAKSNNEMARIAKNEYLLLLNDDTMIPSGCLRIMYNTFKRDATIGAVGCIIRYMDAGQIQHAGIAFNEYSLPYEINRTNTPNGNIEQTRNVPAVTAACVMIPKKVWSELHGFDERFVNGWEDNDLMLRMRELGYSVWVTGETHIRHVRHGSKAYGRLAKEDQNVQLFKSIWIDTNRIKQVL